MLPETRRMCRQSGEAIERPDGTVYGFPCLNAPRNQSVSGSSPPPGRPLRGGEDKPSGGKAHGRG
jgi:hypothetical protein